MVKTVYATIDNGAIPTIVIALSSLESIPVCREITSFAFFAILPLGEDNSKQGGGVGAGQVVPFRSRESSGLGLPYERSF
jgi:hypothetical protein